MDLIGIVINITVIRYEQIVLKRKEASTRSAPFPAVSWLKPRVNLPLVDVSMTKRAETQHLKRISMVNLAVCR